MAEHIEPTSGPEDEAEQSVGNTAAESLEPNGDVAEAEAAHREGMEKLAEDSAAGNQAAADDPDSGTQLPGAGDLDAGEDSAPRGF